MQFPTTGEPAHGVDTFALLIMIGIMHSDQRNAEANGFFLLMMLLMFGGALAGIGVGALLARLPGKSKE